MTLPLADIADLSRLLVDSSNPVIVRQARFKKHLRSAKQLKKPASRNPILKVKVKGKVIPLQARCGPEGEGSAAHPGRTLPPGKTRYPFYRRLGGPQGRSGLAENLVPTGI